MRPDNPDEVRKMVEQGYATVAESRSGCCGPGPAGPSCCGPSFTSIEEISKHSGYSDAQLVAVPEGANLGLGCGNPTAIDEIGVGETVLDLGSGAGFDVFLAANQVGPGGKVIGVDMTDPMLARARANAEKGGYSNVEFRKGTIEALPVDDSSVDVIISNCVINLSPEKARVFAEAHRVLRPGGRLMVSDIVLDEELPPEILKSVDAYVGCVGGASLRARYLELMRQAGFDIIEIKSEQPMVASVGPDDPQVKAFLGESGVSPELLARYLPAVKSVQIRAVKSSA